MEIKVPFYNILNMFLTGLVFIGGCLIIFSDTAVALFNSDIIENLGAGPEVVITVCTFAVALSTVPAQLFLNLCSKVPN